LILSSVAPRAFLKCFLTGEMADREVGQDEEVSGECVGDVQTEGKGSAEDACREESVERDVAVVDDVNPQGLGAESGETEQADAEEVEVGAAAESGDVTSGPVECEGGDQDAGEGSCELS
jgi:hypothetical protein